METLLLIKLWLDIRLGLITPLVYTFTILAAASLVTKKLRVFVLSFLLVASIVLGYGYVKNYSNVVLRDQPWSLFQFSPEFTASNILSSFNAAARRSSHSLVTETVLSKTPEDVAHAFLEAVGESDTYQPPMRFFIAQQKEDLLQQAQAAAARWHS